MKKSIHLAAILLISGSLGMVATGAFAYTASFRNTTVYPMEVRCNGTLVPRLYGLGQVAQCSIAGPSKVSFKLYKSKANPIVVSARTGCNYTATANVSWSITTNMTTYPFTASNCLSSTQLIP